MKKRVFIAINLPAETKTALQKLLTQLKKINNRPVIHYVKVKGIHLTLHFLGYLDETQIEQVKDVLKTIAKKHLATKMLTGPIAAFPNLKNPRVIFLAGQEVEFKTLNNLHSDLAEALMGIGLILDSRPWQPHLTLARVVGPCQFKTDQVVLPDLVIPIKSIELMESQLLSQGAEYKILASYGLKN